MRRVPAFHLLRTFETAARLGSFAAAADDLHLTPSAVSHQIRELEAHFGRALFRRVHRGVELLPQGRELAGRLSGAFDLIEAACGELDRRVETSSLVVHCAPSFASQWLGPRLRAFTDAHPEIAITLSSAAEPADLVKERALDVAISYGQAVRRAGLTVTPLGVEEFAPMCTPALRASAPARTLLREQPLIFSPLSRIRWEDWFAHQGIEACAGRRLSFDRAALGIAAAAAGMGIVLETLRLAEHELADGSLVVLDDPALPSMRAETHFLAVRTSERHAPRIAAFTNWLLAMAGIDIPDH